MNGFLVIDKPGGMTSRDAVNRAQLWFPRRTKIGHTGTLDPLATGVLVLCVGAATKLAERVQAMPKRYETRIRLGATSDTDDADGQIAESPEATEHGLELVQSELQRFLGVIQQLPPQYSALKVQGRRAYDLARSGVAVTLQPRPVRVDSIELRGCDWPWLDLTIDCGKGTYIRSIARDLGAALGVGGLVQSLRRTRVGPFAVEQGIGLQATPDEARAALLGLDAIGGMLISGESGESPPR